MRIAGYCVAAVLLFGIDLLFAGSVGWHEVVAGIPAGLVAAAIIPLAHDRSQRRLRVRPTIAALSRPLLALLTETCAVGLVLVRAIWRRPDGDVGTLLRQPFIAGGHTPRDTGRRGLVTLLASLAPGGLVLHVPGGTDMILIHRLSPKPASRDRNWPT